jgi:hypothetical protein
MTKDEYLIATNRVRISAAKTILFDVSTGDDWGVSGKEMAELLDKICVIEKRLFDLINLDG